LIRNIIVFNVANIFLLQKLFLNKCHLFWLMLHRCLMN